MVIICGLTEDSEFASVLQDYIRKSSDLAASSNRIEYISEIIAMNSSIDERVESSLHSYVVFGEKEYLAIKANIRNEEDPKLLCSVGRKEEGVHLLERLESIFGKDNSKVIELGEMLRDAGEKSFIVFWNTHREGDEK